MPQQQLSLITNQSNGTCASGGDDAAVSAARTALNFMGFEAVDHFESVEHTQTVNMYQSLSYAAH